MKHIKLIRSVFGLTLIFLIKDLFGQGIEVTVTPESQDIANYQTVYFYITVTPSGGFDEQVFFSVVSTNLPAGYTATFCPTSIFYPYTGGDTLKVTLDNVHPVTADCYIIFQAGNGPVQVQDTVFLRLVGSFCDWVYQTSTPDDFTNIVIDVNGVKWMYGHSWVGLLKYDGNSQTHYTTSNLMWG